MNPARQLLLLLLFILPALEAPAALLVYKDKMGRTVTITTPVKRAVLYETYELLPVTGSWNQVAGLSRYAFTNDLLLALKPDLSRKIPSVGSAMDANAETLLKVKPDIVLTWTINPEIVHFLEKKGLAVIAVYPESIAELYDVMRLQGRLFGRERYVEHAIARMEGMFALIRKRVASIPPAKRKKALYLTGKQTTVNGRIGVTDDLLSMMNLVNAAKEIDQRSAEVSLEKIIAWNPDIIYIWGNARYGATDLVSNPQWRHIRAVREHRVFKAPKWGTWSPRLAPIALWMAAAAYPAEFRDIDVTRATDQFYRDVYGIPYEKMKKAENRSRF
jgi:iron complex transport system substrate-binding protein